MGSWPGSGLHSGMLPGTTKTRQDTTTPLDRSGGAVELAVLVFRGDGAEETAKKSVLKTARVLRFQVVNHENG